MKAKAAHYTYYIAQARNNDIDSDAYLGFEETLITSVEEWSKTTKAANFYIYTEKGYLDSWAEDVKEDLVSILFASIASGLYIFLFLGSFSPTHCRCMVSFGGILSVAISFFSGFGLLYYCGEQTSNFHSWLPFLLMCIGVEHMFVICNAIDQTSLYSSAYSRVHEALSIAGPAITITSATTSLAFALGMFSSL